jgi:serine protease inhibitor
MLRSLVAVLSASALLVGCSQDTTKSQIRVNPELADTLSETETIALATTLNQLGFEVHTELLKSNENTVTSPVSLGALLALLAAGAEGQASTDLNERLGLNAADDTAIGALLAQLATARDVELAIANSVWTNDGIELLKPYESFVQDTYGAETGSLSLGKQEGADAIDEWAKDATNNKIDSIAEPLGLPDPDAATVLLNAVYFNGSWTTEFDPSNTREMSFSLSNGSTIAAPTMSLSNDKLWEGAESETYALLRLPYGEDERFVMEILLPNDVVDMADFFETLEFDEWQATRAKLVPAVGSVSLPKFTTKSEQNLNDSLNSVGLESIYVEDALAGISGPNTILSTVAQSVYIKVDEQGTEAAAVTGGAVGITSVPNAFDVNRPFAFAITDQTTGAILFLGAINNPTK